VTACELDEYSSFGVNKSAPALGMAWATCVNTRISLQRDSTAMRTSLVINECKDTASLSGDDAVVLASIDGKKRKYTGRTNAEFPGTRNPTAPKSSRNSTSDYDQSETGTLNTFEYYQEIASLPLENTHNKSGSLRSIHLDFSPCRASARCNYEIDADGVRGVVSKYCELS
jgi:hypothetical protein